MNGIVKRGVLAFSINGVASFRISTITSFTINITNHRISIMVFLHTPISLYSH